MRWGLFVSCLTSLAVMPRWPLVCSYSAQGAIFFCQLARGLTHHSVFPICPNGLLSV